VLHCDASKLAWGGVLNNHQPARGFWRSHQRDHHITMLELKAVRFTVESFLHSLSGKQVLLWEDNQAVMHILTNLTSRSPELMAELRKLWWILDNHSISLRARYIRSAANVWADRLSRQEDRTDWMFNPTLFAQLDKLWGPHTIDRFASANNHQVPRYNSQWADPSSEHVDSLTLPDAAWASENNWVNPPWHLLELVVEKLRNSGSAATVVAPSWEGELWHQQLLEMCDAIQHFDPAFDTFLPGRQGSCAGVGRARWSVTAFRIRGRAPTPT
jgi:hypothetical protein